MTNGKFHCTAQKSIYFKFNCCILNPEPIFFNMEKATMKYFIFHSFAFENLFTRKKMDKVAECFFNTFFFSLCSPPDPQLGKKTKEV